MAENKDRIGIIVKDFVLDSAKVDKDLIGIILGIDIVNTLDSHSIKEISSYIVALSQFLISLTFKINMTRVSKRILSKTLEDAILRELKSSKFVGNKDEKRRQLIDSRNDLLAIENELEELTAELLLLEEYPESIREYINAFKKYRDTIELELKNTRLSEVI